MPTDPKKQGAFAAKVEQTLGIIPGTKLWSPFPFSGVNLQDTPPAIDDKEFSYLENFFHLGNGYLRTAWDAGTPFYTATGQTIIYFFWYNIGTVDYVIVFFSDGTAIQVQQSNGAVVPVSANLGTFFVSGASLPICSQWGTKYIIIANNFGENNYWIWDGALLYTAGSASPTINLTSAGENYSTLPTVTAFNGAGSGVVVIPTIENGSITTLVFANPGSGYVLGDTVQLQFKGGGSDTGAILLANLGSGSVGSVQVTNGGAGYTSTPTVIFSPPTGATAMGVAVLSTGFPPGVVKKVNITNPGGGYTSEPTIFFSGGGGAGAEADATIQGGAVVAVTMDNGGSLYSTPPTVTFSAPTGAVTATGTAVVVGNVVTSITITNPGKGYTSPPTITITGGGGTNAAATAYLASGGISGVQVIDGGSNYTQPPVLSFVGGNGTGAVGLTQLNPTTVQFVNVTSGGGPGYTSPPTVHFNNSGTNGSGAAGTAIIENGIVVGVTVTNAGSGYTLPPYVTFTGGGLPTSAPTATAQVILTGTSIASVLITNQGMGYTQAPAVVVAPGSNNAASALLEMMPFGVSGNALETFNSRVWLSYPFQKTTIPTGGDFLVSAPGSLNDFATSDGGVLFVNSDRFLKKNYTGLRQSNGYLYFFGDSSCSVASNINTTGNPATTTFSYENVDPQTGMAWRDTAQDFGRTIVFANQTGIYGLYGGAATKISGKLDTLFANAIFPPTGGALVPTAAVATIFNIKHYFLLFTVKDPETAQVRNVMACWNEREWTLVSQTPALNFLATQEVNSELSAWGTDGTAIYPLFTKQSPTLKKRLTTKYYGTDQLLLLKDFLNIYLQAQDTSIGSVGINCSVNMVASGIAVQPTGLNISTNSAADAQYSSANYSEALFQQPVFSAPSPYWSLWGTGTGGLSFSTLGIQFSTTSPDFILSNIAIAYQDSTAYQ